MEVEGKLPVPCSSTGLQSRMLAPEELGRRGFATSREEQRHSNQNKRGETALTCFCPHAGKGQLDSLLHTSHHQAGLKAATSGGTQGKMPPRRENFHTWVSFHVTHETLTFLQRSLPARGKATGSAASRAAVLQPVLGGFGLEHLQSSSRGAPLPTETHCFQLRASRFGEIFRSPTNPQALLKCR